MNELAFFNVLKSKTVKLQLFDFDLQYLRVFSHVFSTVFQNFNLLLTVASWNLSIRCVKISVYVP